MNQLLLSLLPLLNMFIAFKLYRCKHIKLSLFSIFIASWFLGLHYLLYAYVDILAVILMLLYTVFNVLALIYCSKNKKDSEVSPKKKSISKKEIINGAIIITLLIIVFSFTYFKTWDIAMKRKDILNLLEDHPNTTKIIDDNKEYIIKKGTPFVNSYNIEVRNLENND